ncbi:hypothetical protein G9A89_006644 [Geosiphon pyriformis]|nr:hypothetical protein G9A89_006644 [Geosiphon pyriformis]
MDSVYSYAVSYKKPKKLKAGSVLVDSSIGSLALEDIGIFDNKPTISWESEVESIASSVSGLSDVENMANMVAEKTSYTESGNSPKAPTFNTMSNDESVLSLLSLKFNGSNQLPSVKLYVLEKCSFEPVKSFALNVKLAVVPGKTNSDKLIVIKKIFYQIDGFGEASTPSKFPDIIRASFTSEFSINKARNLAICKKIIVNNDLKRVNSCSDREMIIKEIPVDLSKLVIESVFSKFGKVVSIKVQLIGLWQKTLVEFEFSKIANLVVAKWSVFVGKDSVCVAKVVGDKQMWTLLYMLSVGTTTHNLLDLVNFYGGKTCFIGHNPGLYAHDRCAVVCFDSEASKLAAINSVPVYKSVNLHWTGLFLACCAKYKQYGHISNMCSVCLANIYKKKQASVVYLVSFGGKSWAQVAGGSPFYVFLSVLSGVGSLVNMNLLVITSNPLDDSDITKSFVRLGFRYFKKIESCEFALDLNMMVDGVVSLSFSSVPLVNKAALELSLSSSKMLTTKVGGFGIEDVGSGGLGQFGFEEIELFVFWFGFISSSSISMISLVWKIATCNVQSINNPAKQDDIICWHKKLNNLISIIMNKYDGFWVFTSGLDSGHMDSGVAIVMNIFLVKHVYKVSEVPGQLLSIKLLFKNKLSAGEVNSLIAKAVNESFFIILDGNFNKNSLHKSMSFKKCLDLGLVNSLSDSPVVKSFTWENLRGVKKTIDFMLVSSNLVNAVVDHNVVDSANDSKWKNFKDVTSANAGMFANKFATTVQLSDMNVMHAEEAYNKVAINKRIKSFESDKNHIIRSVLKHPFCKVVLDYLVVGDELVLKPSLVKSRVDGIMEGWTRKHRVMPDISDKWFCQYWLLEYVFDNVFSNVICPVGVDELLGVVSNLPKGIYLLTKGLSKPSLAKAHFDVQFFANLVFKKAVSDKQFSYLVLAILFLIVDYKTQFSYVLKQLDLYGPVPAWFKLSVQFLGGVSSLSVYFSSWNDGSSSNILCSCEFNAIRANLLCSNVGRFSVYTDGSLSGLGSVDIKAGTAVFFKDIGMGLGIGVSGLMSFTLTELQAIALALKCVSPSCLIDLFSDSQAALDACKLELDFRNCHLGVLGNKCVNKLARAVAFSSWNLPHSINECYLRIGGAAISGNSRHFVRDVFWSVHRAHWEIGFGSWVVVDSLCADID